MTDWIDKLTEKLVLVVRLSAVAVSDCLSMRGHNLWRR